MALGSNHVKHVAGNGGVVAAGTAQSFIPEIWSDEIIAQYENSLVVKPLIRHMSMVGKKGDTVHIPKPDRGSASPKTPESQVTLIAANTNELVVTIDRHFEYSRMIEDITDVQALASLRRFYTEDAGYALAKQVDTDLVAEAANFSNDVQFAGGGIVTAAGTADAKFTDAGFRAAIQLLDDADVPMTDRRFVISPALKNELLGTSGYVSTDFVTGKPTETGVIGNLYGVELYVTTNLPTENTDEKGSLLFHKDAIVMVEQLGVRTQTQYKLEYTGDLMVSDTIYGTSIYRPECGVRIYGQV